MAKNENKPGSLRLDDVSSLNPSSATTRVRPVEFGWTSLVALIWILAAVALLIGFPLWRTHPTQVGESAPTTVVAPSTIEVIDEAGQQQRKDALFESKRQVWVYDGEVNSRAIQRLNAFFETLNNRSPTSVEQLQELSVQLIEQQNIALESKTIWQFVQTRLERLEKPVSQDRLRKELEYTLRDLLQQFRILRDGRDLYRSHQGSGVLSVVSTHGEEIQPSDVDHLLLWKQEVRDFLRDRRLMQIWPEESYTGLRDASTELLLEVLEPNLAFDKEQTDNAYQRELTRIEQHPLKYTYQAGEEIVRAGTRLTPQQAAALAWINETSINQLTLRLAGISAIVMIFFAAIFMYMRRFRREIKIDPQTVTLMAVPPLIAFGIGQTMLVQGADSSIVMLWFPSAMVGILGAILLVPQVAMIMVLSTVSLFAVASGRDLDFMMLALFGGFAAVLTSRTIRSRDEIFWVGVKVGIVNAVAVAVLALVHAHFPKPMHLLMAFLNAMACLPASLILLRLFEKLFGVVTDIGLLELSGLRNELIQELEDRAPGTYQHVLNVTKLAEAAADAIGANYLLVRAGAYFHDIGKMVKPKYFSENQVTQEDKKLHSKLSPNMSTLIIKNHVKEGLEMAQRAKLPPKVIDFIPQHHGTGLIKYFYFEAVRRNEETEGMDRVNEEDFRYPGPKPQTVESAVVLLADSVEAIAASRFSGSQVNEHELRHMVQETISDRFNDGQFDECDLTLRDLYLIREAFVRTLKARYHFRIAYPKAPTVKGDDSEKTNKPAARVVAAGGQ